MKLRRKLCRETVHVEKLKHYYDREENCKPEFIHSEGDDHAQAIKQGERQKKNLRRIRNSNNKIQAKNEMKPSTVRDAEISDNKNESQNYQGTSGED